MIVTSFRLKNYRRLSGVDLVLNDKKTILVGANNSGKTSCIGALHTFLMKPENLRVRDISKQHWKQLIELGKELESDEISAEQLDQIASRLSNLTPRLDVVISAKAHEAFKAREIIPDLNWKGGELAVRIAYEPEKIAVLASDYKRARDVVAEHSDVSLWPENLFDFLEKAQNFPKYIKQRHYILKTKEQQDDESSLQPLSSSALKRLVRIDVISEQRGLGTEDTKSQTGAFSEKQQLNKLLREYYDRFLNPEDYPEEGDLEVLKKQQAMEHEFSTQLRSQFKAPLNELAEMGYPGIGGNPSVELAAKVSGSDALQKNSSVQYRFNKTDEDTLPESYLGLGYQNLIYLTFRLLQFRERWMRSGKSLSSDDDLADQIEPVHLVLVEEPEVNLHAQVQRVFVANAYKTLRNHAKLNDKQEYQTQLVVSTHSSHVVNDVDFKDLRYFKRCPADGQTTMDHTVVENMSDLFAKPTDETKFVRKHLKLSHCDIFFADGVIFVEGQAERLLVPEFINKHHPSLAKRYVSLLEVSGAHTHKYETLIEKLGVVTLVITDLDTVDADGKKCPPKQGEGQSTNNDTLKSWHPKKTSIDDLISLEAKDCAKDDGNAPIHIAYQKLVTIGDKHVLARTFEDALILANWRSDFFEAIPKVKQAREDFEGGTEDLAGSLFEFVQGLTKGDFAFKCLFHLAEDDANFFVPPQYISDGLDWLDKNLTPNQ
ncbi:AAA family ATPase [Gymnodinialimonas sp. 2305UL16-5]|uniref:AAA family ATPase n=1 Tax=Gymnodinialimonas mytili TaxID=3126503 RepID=UPI0030983F4E